MIERYNPSALSNREAVLSYYQASEGGYWGYLKGRCHYGYTPDNDEGRFDMESAQLEMERRLGETLGLPCGSKVLDAGCGYSPVARTLTEKFRLEVTGIDLIHRRLLKGSELNQGADMPSINLASADYQELPFADESFDGVYTMETLVHAYDFRLALDEFRRVLKPGGKVVLFEYSIPELDSVPTIVRNLAERVIRNTGMASLPCFTHGSFTGILEDVGFENAEVENISRNVYPSWFYLWKFAIRQTLEEFSHGRISLDNIPGSVWIWPARHKLRYNICQASKPQ